MEFLETTKPLVTFTEDKLPMFEKIVTKYNWELTEIVDGIYNDGIREFSYSQCVITKDKLLEIIPSDWNITITDSCIENTRDDDQKNILILRKKVKK